MIGKAITMIAAALALAAPALAQDKPAAAKLSLTRLDCGTVRVNSQPFAHWISGGGTVEPVERDKDIFGDGRVVMLDMPGHTPGHHTLLVRLAGAGPVLLSGDQAHFQENYDSDGVPEFNTDRAETLASFDRFKGLAKNLGATVIIQHEPRDVVKLPPFPKAAE